MDLLPSEIARLVWAYLSDFEELKTEAESFLHKCPDLRELSLHLKRGGRICSKKVNEKSLQDHLNDINKPSMTTIEFDEQRLICSITNSIDELFKNKLSQLSQKEDLDKQQKIIENKLEQLIEKHSNFDKLNQTIAEQFTQMTTLLKEITAQNNQLQNGIASFSEQINGVINAQKESLTTMINSVSDKNYNNQQFKYLEGKLKVEITNKSQYVTQFVLNEFKNLKNLLESIVNSNYERIESSTSQLKDCNRRYQSVQQSLVPSGQETPPSETCRNEAAMSAINTPTSELCSQSPSYSDLSLGDLISDDARADLNRQISQAVVLAANTQPAKYADLITNVLYKTATSSQVSGMIFTPQKHSEQIDGFTVPQTPSLQEKAGPSGNNFCLNFNLVRLIDDILQSNSPLKNVLGPKCAQLSTQKLFPATPDITLDLTNPEFKRPDPIVKNFADLIKTPKPKDIQNHAEVSSDVNHSNDNVGNSNNKENSPNTSVITNKKDTKPDLDNFPSSDNLEIEEGEIHEPMDEDLDSNQSNQTVPTELVSIPAPVFANQHIIDTQTSPQHPITTIEVLTPSPNKKSDAPLTDLTNTKDGCFKVPSSTAPTKNINRGRAQKFAFHQEQLRMNFGENTESTTPQQILPTPLQATQNGPVQSDSIQTEVIPTHSTPDPNAIVNSQIYYQESSGVVVYTIDPSQMICLNDLQGNTYIQTTSGFEQVFYQPAIDSSSTTITPQPEPSPQGGTDSTTTPIPSPKRSSTNPKIPVISVSTFTGSPVPVYPKNNNSTTPKNSSKSNSSPVENKEPPRSKNDSEKSEKIDESKSRKRRKISDEPAKDDKSKHAKQARSSKYTSSSSSRSKSNRR